MTKSNNMELCFEEQDFDDFLNKLKKYPNIECLGEVIEHSWGQRVIRFYDLDGHIIEVGEDMKINGYKPFPYFWYDYGRSVRKNYLVIKISADH